MKNALALTGIALLLLTGCALITDEPAESREEPVEEATAAPDDTDTAENDVTSDSDSDTYQATITDAGLVTVSIPAEGFDEDLEALEAFRTAAGDDTDLAYISIETFRVPSPDLFITVYVYDEEDNEYRFRRARDRVTKFWPWYDDESDDYILADESHIDSEPGSEIYDAAAHLYERFTVDTAVRGHATVLLSAEVEEQGLPETVSRVTIYDEFDFFEAQRVN